MKNFYDTEIIEKEYTYKYSSVDIAHQFEQFFKKEYKIYRVSSEGKGLCGKPKLSFWFFKLLLEAKYNYKFKINYEEIFDYRHINQHEICAVSYQNGGKYTAKCEELAFGIIFKDKKFFWVNCFLKDAWEQESKIENALNQKQEWKHKSLDEAEKTITLKYQLKDITKIINSISIFDYEKLVQFNNGFKKREALWRKYYLETCSIKNYTDFFKYHLTDKEFARISENIKQNILFVIQNEEGHSL